MIAILATGKKAAREQASSPTFAQQYASPEWRESEEAALSKWSTN